jgi:hypothetical protein
MGEQSFTITLIHQFLYIVPLITLQSLDSHLNGGQTVPLMSVFTNVNKHVKTWLTRWSGLNTVHTLKSCPLAIPASKLLIH